MVETRLQIINQLGLHARAAAQLVRLAESFKSNIRMERLDKNIVANAKSILSVLTLAASFGTQLRLIAEGEDEKVALDAIEKLFTEGFGEL
jgi:phosphotransferase system HPr (HPr) family protein